MRIKLISRLSLAMIAVAAVTICFGYAKDAAPSVSLTTQERMYSPDWWPTKGDPAAKEYAGESQCAKCHGEISALQKTTSMYRAGTIASRSAILAKYPDLKFQEGSYSYSLGKTGSGVTYSASDGINSKSKSVEWAFGDGEAGQTYLFKGKSGFSESRLSYFTSAHALNITTGHSEQVPGSLEESFGHTLSLDTARRCFGCHTTGATTSDAFKAEGAIPGVTCEACHGPGAKHVAAMIAGREGRSAVAITNPGSMSPADSVDFCGACHRTWADVAVFMPANLGLVAVRFQPYRLERSRCWGKTGDARITCIACHDPHKPLVHEMTAYDAKCLACHRSLGSSQAGATAKACKTTNTSNCASCHMPRYEVPQTHALFTDHEIRIIRTNLPSHDETNEKLSTQGVPVSSK